MRIALQATIFSAFALSAPGLAAESSANFYDWMGLAEEVAVASAEKADGRLARFRIVSPVRGSRLEVDDRILVDRWLANDRRARGRAPLSFEPDTEYVLLLRSADRRRRRDFPLFELVRGVDGARELPPERGESLKAAVIEWAEIQERRDESLKWRRLEDHLSSPNPWLVETSLGMHLRFGRGEPDLLPTLLPLFDHPRPGIRSAALRLVEATLEGHADPSGEDGPPGLHGRLAALARADEEPAVRIEAVEALDRLDRPGTEALLEEIAASDPDQTVRLAAATRLLERGPAAAAPD